MLSFALAAARGGPRRPADEGGGVKVLVRSWFVRLLALGSAAAAVAGPPQRPAPPLRLPSTILFDRSTDSPAPVPFSHRTHVDKEKGSCLGCHPEPYKMLRPERRSSHAEMDADRLCGRCHDGKAAFATTDGDRCDLCHGAKVAP